MSIDSVGVVIIGAGFSGLGAANALFQNGFKDFLILEGRNRVGGRSYTSYELGDKLPVDLGSAWIQGKCPENPILTIARQHSIPFADVDASDTVSGQSHAFFFDGGTKMSDTEVDEMKKAHLDPFLVYVRQQQQQQQHLMKRRQSDMSFRQFFDKYLEDNKQISDNKKVLNFLEAALHATIVTEYASNLEDLSFLSWYGSSSDEPNGGGDCFMAVGHSGYNAIVDALAMPFRTYVQLSSVVKAIERCEDMDKIRISYSYGEETKQIVARHVIVTLPLGVLKANVVKFTPPLPMEKQIAINKLGNGIFNKCILYWDDEDKVFWPKNKDYLVRLITKSTSKSGEDNWLEFYNAYKFNGNKNVLIGLSAGRDASAIELLSDEQVKRDAVASLRKMFRNVPEPSKVIVTRWEKDEFSRGSYSFDTVGCTQQHRADLSEPIDGEIFFAGEATDAIYPSTTQGALKTGERAAREVMEAMNSKRCQ